MADSGLGSREGIGMMVVISTECPLSNLMFHASRNSAEVIRRALQRADNMLDEGQSQTEECRLNSERRECRTRSF